MPGRKYTRLTEEDKERLGAAAISRWKAFIKRLAISLLLPVACVFAIMVFLLLVTHSKKGGIDLSEEMPPAEVFLVVLIPAAVLVVIANIAMFIRSIPPVYCDMIRGRKRLIEFKPAPYTLPESDKYYIETKIPLMPFLEVTSEQYTWLDYNNSCYLEIAPFSKIILGFRTIDENNMIK